MEKEYDLFLFLGQSNMAGRGVTSPQWPESAPALTPGAGYEYRAVSDPGRLHPASEPFGVNENNPDGICEPGMKTGSMVTAFINAYYARTKIPVIGVSASKLSKELPDVVLACDAFHTMRARGLMKDDFHYYQTAYNEVGTMAGNAAGEFVRRL